MTTRTLLGVEIADGDRVRLTFQTPWRRSIGGRIPVEGEIEKTVEGEANVTESVFEDEPPMFHLETDEGDRLSLYRAHEFTYTEWEHGRKKRVPLTDEHDISGWVVGKKDDRANRDDNPSTRGHVPVGTDPELELAATA